MLNKLVANSTILIARNISTRILEILNRGSKSIFVFVEKDLLMLSVVVEANRLEEVIVTLRDPENEYREITKSISGVKMLDILYPYIKIEKEYIPISKDKPTHACLMPDTNVFPRGRNNTVLTNEEMFKVKRVVASFEYFYNEVTETNELSTFRDTIDVTLLDLHLNTKEVLQTSLIAYLNTAFFHVVIDDEV